MTMIVSNLKEQNDSKFAELFGYMFPHGINTDKIQTMRDYRLAVRSQIFRFSCNEKFYIHFRCDSCTQDSYLAVWDVAETMASQSPIQCCCMQGHFIPVYREKKVS